MTEWIEGRGSIFDPGKITIKRITIGNTIYNLSVRYEYYLEQRGKNAWKYIVSSNPKGLPGKVTPVKIGFALSKEEAKKEAEKILAINKSPIKRGSGVVHVRAHSRKGSKGVRAHTRRK